jgi:hypothetical protein
MIGADQDENHCRKGLTLLLSTGRILTTHVGSLPRCQVFAELPLQFDCLDLATARYTGFQGLSETRDDPVRGVQSTPRARVDGVAEDARRW